ncbi:hypothetical protein M9458_053419, partial [Cirrhinus mrigala]
WSSRGLRRFRGMDTVAKGDLASATPDPAPSPPSPSCVEHMPKPTADGEPELAATDEPSPHGVTELLVMSVQMCEPATMPATREKAVASDIVEGSSAYCIMAESELVEDLGLYEAEGVLNWDIYTDLPPLLPPSSEWTETAMPEFSPEGAPLPELSPDPSAHPQSSICAVGSPLVCQSPSALQLEDPLSPPPASESRTLPRPVEPAAPSWLLVPSFPPWPGSPLAPPGSLIPLAPPWAVYINPSPWDSTPQAPPSLRLHLGPLSQRVHHGLPDPHLRIGCRRHLFHLFLLDSPRHPGSLALCLGFHLLCCRWSAPLETSALPPPWLLPLSAPPWVVIMAMAWVPPGSSCSKSLLSPSGSPWSFLMSHWLLPPSGPPWSILSSPWLLPPSSSPRTLFVVLLPDVHPPPKIPSMPPSVVIVVYSARTHLPGGGAI